MPLLFFQQLHETLADFNNFWHATLRRNLTQRPPYLNVVATLPCEMQKSQFGHGQQ